MAQDGPNVVKGLVGVLRVFDNVVPKGEEGRLGVSMRRGGKGWTRKGLSSVRECAWAARHERVNTNGTWQQAKVGDRRQGQESERRGDGNGGAVMKTECAAALDRRETRAKGNENAHGGATLREEERCARRRGARQTVTQEREEEECTAARTQKSQFERTMSKRREQAETQSRRESETGKSASVGPERSSVLCARRGQPTVSTKIRNLECENKRDKRRSCLGSG
ncbi:hypothetical protein BC826DRAFT_965592 [Russula brevipes]|nr:hypothetical protein BC826DRAFT_965592 [Russula brevipes]